MLVAGGDSVPFCSLFAFSSGLVLPVVSSCNAECRNASAVGEILSSGSRPNMPITVTLFKFAVGLNLSNFLGMSIFHG